MHVSFTRGNEILNGTRDDTGEVGFDVPVTELRLQLPLAACWGQPPLLVHSCQNLGSVGGPGILDRGELGGGELATTTVADGIHLQGSGHHGF